ncbi:MAG: hypothetical protein NVS9B3_04340 [Gemmatimonadaceae bacterium]
MSSIGRVVAAVAPLNAEPSVSSAQSSQALYGHRLAILQSSGDWHQVRGADGYEGWMHRGYLAQATGHAAGIVQAPTLSLGVEIRSEAQRSLLLPVGAVPAPSDTVVHGDVVQSDERRRRFPLSPSAVARTAASVFTGASYQWGGITPWGVDCSGLVQTAFAIHGIALPRDAWQQASAGTEVADAPERLAAGDLLFFSDRDDGRITHVGIALGEGRMIHSALGRGGVAVERLNDGQDSYVVALRTRFRGARRISRTAATS